MVNNDGKNIFDDDLLSESADSLFGENVNNQIVKNNPKKSTKINENKKEKSKNKKNKNISKNSDNLPDGSKLNFENDKQNNLLKKESQKSDKKPRKKLSTTNLIIIIIVSAIVVAGAITGAIFYFKKINTKLQTPEFSVVQRQNNTLIYISEIENSTAYEVVITPTNSNSFSFTTTESVIELKSYLNQAGTFVIKIRALGKTDKAASDFSIEQTITNNKTLDTPYIFKDDNNILSWNPVKNADKYRLYYKENSETGVLNYIEIDQNDVLITFDLKNLNAYGVGVYPVCVEAIAQSESFYLNSNVSNSIEYRVVEKLQAPINVIFNKSSKKISFMVLKNKTLPSKFNVVFTLNDHTLQEFSLLSTEMEASEETYKLQQVVKFTAYFDKLIDSDIVSATIVSVSQNEFVTNSDSVQLSFS